MELASSDAAAILFFLEEEKEKNGGANRADSVAHPYKGSQKIHGIATPVCALARNGVSILDLYTVAGDYVSSPWASFLEIQSTRRQFFRRWMGCDWLTDFAPERTSSPSVPDRACRVSGSRLRTVLSME